MKDMKQAFLKLVTAALILSPLPGFCTDPVKSLNAPILFVEEPLKDMGTLVEGNLIRHTFLLTNKGGSPLIIDRVETDCSCTKVNHDPLIQPNRNSYLRVALDTSGRAGTWTRTLRLFSNDPRSPETQLSIKAHILKAVTVKPDRIFFNGTVGNVLDQTVTIKAPDEKPFALKLKESRLSEQVGFYIEPKKNHYLVHIRNRAEKAQTGRGRIFLSTDIPHHPLITIPVFSRIQDSVRIFPSTIDFGKVKKSSEPGSGRIVTRSVNLKYTGSSVPEIKSMGMDQKNFEIKADSLQTLGIIRIEISADINAFEPGKHMPRLEMELNSPTPRTISIPVLLEVI